jgi:hypothetical protein
MDLPHSDAIFVVAYPAETTEAFCDGHVRAFGFFDGVPQLILYDDTKIAVARILGDGKRQRTRVFSELQSHYLSRDHRAPSGSAPKAETMSSHPDGLVHEAVASVCQLEHAGLLPRPTRAQR